MQVAFASTAGQQIRKRAVWHPYMVIILICIIVPMFFLCLGPSFACYAIDGATFRAGILVEDHWGNLRNPEIYFSHGSYTWVTGTDLVIVGTYQCMAGNIVTQYGDTFRLSVGGVVLTADGVGYRRVILKYSE